MEYTFQDNSALLFLPEPVPPAITKLAGLLSSPSIHTRIIAARRELTVPNLANRSL